MKIIGIQIIFCLMMLCTLIRTESNENIDNVDPLIEQLAIQKDDTDIERSTEVTVQTSWIYIKMLSDDPFLQATLSCCAGLFIIASIALVGHHYASTLS